MAKWTSENTSDGLAAFSDNPKLKKELRKRRIRRIAIVVGVLLVVGLAAKPVYQKYRAFRIDQILEKAQSAARLEDWPTARAAARTVLISRPQDFEAFRIWTRALGQLGEPRTYLAAAMMFTNPKAGRDDQLEALRIMARQAPDGVTLGAYLSLPEDTREEIDFLTALSPLMTRRGGAAIVEQQLGATEDFANHPGARLEMIRALAARPSEERVEQAREHFAWLIENRYVAQALDALEILGETPGGLTKGSPLPPLAEWVGRQPEAETIHHLLALHPRIEGLPEAGEAVFREAIERFSGIDPGVLGTWLVRHGKAEMALEMLEEPAKTRSDAYVAMLHALLRSGREGKIDQALEEPPPSADLVDLALIRAVMARREGDKPAELSAWNDALKHAAFDNSQNRFLEIARYASGLGANRAAEDAWVAAIRVGWGPLPLYLDLQPRFASLASQGRSEDLLAMFRALLRFEPHNVELQNNFYYLGTIHELVAPQAAVDALRGLVEEHPDKPEFVSGLAMALLRNGQPGEVLPLMATIRSSDRVAPMMADALEGTARVMLDEAEAGRALLAKVEWKAFMRQERAAFRQLLVDQQVADLPLPDIESTLPDSDPTETSEWRKAVEKLEKARENDTLPALPPIELPQMPELE